MLPIGPVVAAHRAPVVERMANAFVRENAGEVICGAGVFPLPSTGGEVNVAGSKLPVDPGVGKIGNVVHGIVEVKIVVVHSIHEIAQVVNAGHGEAALDDVRMFEERIGSVIRAERRAHGGDCDLRLAVAPDKWDDFFSEIRIENGLEVTPMKGMRGLVVKAQAVNRVNGIKLDAAGVNKIGEGTDQSLPFQLPFI